MAHASVKLTASSSDYKTQMKSAAAQMKELSSEYSVAATKAKLFGSATDGLKAKAESLTQKITTQKNIVKMNSEEQERLTKRLEDQKNKHEQLKTKVEAARKAYQDEKKATGESSDATKTLKEELDKLEKEFKENESAIGRTETALGKQTAATNNSKVKLMEMESELEKVNKELKDHKLTAFAEGCGKAGEKIENFGKRMTVVSAGIATFATSSAKMAVDFEDSIAKVSTIMDEGVMSVDDMQSAIIDLSNETGIAAGDIAENVYNAISAGQDTADAVNFVRESTKLATAGFAESGDTLDLLTTILNSYGLEAEKVTDVSDMLIQTQNLGKTSVAELSSAMGKVIPTANANGVALDQLCTSYAIMTAKGVATAETTTYVNSLLNELGKTGSTTDVILREKTGKSFSELMQSGSNLADVLGIVDGAAKEQNLSMSDMFSSAEAAKAGLILFGDGAGAFNSKLEEMRNSTGATDEAFEKMQTTSYDIKVALNELKNTAMEFGQTIMESAEPMVEQFTEKVHELCEWFGSLDEEQQQTILKVGLFVAAVGPAAVGIGKFAQGISTTIKTGQKFTSWVAGAIGKITAKTAATTAETAATAAGTAATGGMTAAQTALNAVMSMNPIAKVVMLITALVGILALVYNKSETFRNAVNGLWETVKEKFSSIKESIAGAFSDAKEAVANKIEEIKTNVSEGWERIKTAVSEKIESIKNAITEKFEAAKQSVANIFNSIKETVSKAWETIKNVVKVALMAIKEIISAAFQLITLPWRFIWENCKEFIMSAWEAIKNTVTQKIEAIKTVISTVWNAISALLSPILEKIKNNVSKVWENIKTAVSTVLNAIKTAVSTAWNAIKNTVSTVLNAIKGVVTTVWNAIKTAVSTALNAIKSVVDTTWNVIKKSVSTVLDAIKTYVTAGWNQIKSTVSTVMNVIKGVVATVWNAIKTNVSGAVDGVKNAISNGMNAAKSTVSNILENIQSKFSSIFENVKNVVRNAINTIKGFFNFSWSLPHLKMPHPRVSGKFSLNPPSVPHFSIEWYKNGAIMGSQMIFGMNGNTLFAGGEPETGGEAILPLAPFYSKLNDILDKKLAAVKQVQNVYVESHTYIDSEEVSSRTVTKVDGKMVWNKRKSR